MITTKLNILLEFGKVFSPLILREYWKLSRNFQLHCEPFVWKIRLLSFFNNSDS